MSKRPKTANGVMSRLRRPADRLRDLPIWSKLGLIMLVPTLATIIVGVSGLVDHIDTASNAERARTLSVLSEAAGGLVDHLQNERAYGVLITVTRDPSKGAEHKAALQAYKDENPLVDAAKVPYSQQKAALDNVPDKVATLLLRLDRNLEDLPAQRSQIANDQAPKPADVEDVYNRLISDLLAVRDSSAQLANDPTLSDHLRAVAAVATAKEYIAEQRDVGIKVLGAGSLESGLRRELLGTSTGFDLAKTTLRAVGTDSEVQLFDRIGASKEGYAATNLTTPLQNLQGDNIRNIPFNFQSWETAMIGYNKQFRAVEQNLDAGIVKEATDLRNSVNRRVFIETSVLLAMLLLAILFAWLVARSMARSLRELRQGALSVAQFGLPHAVNRLRDPTLSSSLTPAQLADQIAEPLPVRSRDEFGQVTEAFNAVHLEAVRTAAEQAALRSSVATMFVNLARRSQILVDRLIGHLDRLERGEEDPDRLAELFQLDHLATRMRRNDENLLVLAGADSTRVQREPAALIDVLRAAQSEVEHYTRIEFGMIDRDIEVAAHAVNDMVHLVAELFDNATAFSPPNSTVIVEARRLGDSALLSVEDRGIGISREQLRDLNERLANPPMVDVAVSRMMGLVVVARLANRHAVKVELRPSDTERGTVAEVGLPLSVLVSAGAIAERAGSGNKYDMPLPQQQPQQSRPAFPEPLALESGNGGYPGGGRPFDPNPPMNNGGMLGTSGRSVPAWSDLTGAPSNGFNAANGSANGSNGSGLNGFYGPRSNEVIPPLPSGPSTQQPAAPQGFDNFDGLPQRRNGEQIRPDGDSAGFGATIPRQLPANPENQSRGTFVPPVSAPPVPPVSAPPMPSAPPYGGGRPVSGPPVSGPPTSSPASAAPPAWPPVAAEQGPPPHVPESLAAALDMTAEIPRYRPERTGQHPQVERPTNPQTAPIPSAAPFSATPVSATPVSAMPVSAAPASDAQQRATAAAKAAHEVATAQAAEAQATAAAQIAAAQAAARQRDTNPAQFADETMELPIFRELESAWFITARPADAPKAPSTTNVGDESVVTSQRIPTGEPSRTVGVPQQATSPEARDLDPTPVGASAPNGLNSNGLNGNGLNGNGSNGLNGSGSNGNGSNGNGLNGNGSNGNVANGSNGNGSNPWHTAADEGWQAARAAAEAPVDLTTTAGLPKRTPMAQLVPGGVDRGGNSVERRTPEGVRGLLSAYHRGVQRGRTKEQSTNPEVTPGGQQSSQAGKEHEA
ncbi:sensor histidine kinase [Micromonosporaceae bacterium Da 78-11]